MSREIKRGKTSRERFSLEISERDAANGIYSAMKAVVESRGNAFVLDDATRQHIIEAAQWLVNAKGKFGLLLCGMYGNGKTSLARAIANLIEFTSERVLGYSQRKVVRFITAKEICRVYDCGKRIKSEAEEFDKLVREPMLLIDDLGTEPAEVLTYGMPEYPLQNLLEERYDNQRLTIITTNLDAKEIEGHYGKRVRDRLKELLTSIVFKNASYRK